MRLHRVLRGLLLLGIVCGSTAVLAQRRPKEFVAHEMTDEELAAQRERSKYKYTPYDKDVPVETAPFPWLLVGMGALAILGAAPFAYRYYRNTSAEVADSNSFGAPRRGESATEEDGELS